MPSSTSLKAVVKNGLEGPLFNSIASAQKLQGFFYDNFSLSSGAQKRPGAGCELRSASKPPPKGPLARENFLRFFTHFIVQ